MPSQILNFFRVRVIPGILKRGRTVSIVTHDSRLSQAFADPLPPPLRIRTLFI